MRTWEFLDADLRKHVVTFEHRRWSGWQTLTVDGNELVHERKRLEEGSERPFDFHGHHGVLRITRSGFAYDYALLVDRQRVAPHGTTLSTVDELSSAMPVRLGDTELERRVQAGGSWFYWIAGTTLLNVILYNTGSSIGFPIGMLFGFFLEGIAKGLGLPTAGWIGHLGIATGLWLVGRRARRGSDVAFLVGGIAYLGDTLFTFALIQDVLSVAFHALGLWGIYRGWRAAVALRRPAEVAPATAG